jgi:hypothetical protein
MRRREHEFARRIVRRTGAEPQALAHGLPCGRMIGIGVRDRRRRRAARAPRPHGRRHAHGAAAAHEQRIVRLVQRERGTRVAERVDVGADRLRHRLDVERERQHLLARRRERLQPRLVLRRFDARRVAVFGVVRDAQQAPARAGRWRRCGRCCRCGDRALRLLRADGIASLAVRLCLRLRLRRMFARHHSVLPASRT